MKIFGKIIKFFLSLIFFAGFIVLLNYILIELYAFPHTYEPDEIQGTYQTGLLLGTSKYTRKKEKNVFYTYRIQTAEKLYKTKKIQSVLISGDGASKYYNEPRSMQKDLIKAGIPRNKILLDFKGFSTYESITRAKHKFHLDTLVVISQDFHVKRAIFIGRMNGMHVIGVKTKPVKGKRKFKILIRELGARLKATWDLIRNRQNQEPKEKNSHEKKQEKKR